MVQLVSLVALCSLTAVSALTTSRGAGYPTLAQVKQKFYTEGIVPDVLSSFNPTSLFYLTYTGNLSDGTSAKVVLPGTSFARNDTLVVPQFSVEGATNRSYVVVIVDPDAPSRANPTVSQIRHLLAANFTVSDVRSNFVPRSLLLQNSTAAINNYIPPTPPAGSGAHRYVALLYVQPPKFDISSLNVSSISGFNISAFTSSSGLGEPVAGTFLTVEVKNATAI
ncbi:PEBP-like protein [Ceratobasidium sp. AG-I]|nr:PEBP-like protein [Ceratobasidium sp. AG-I]